MNDSTEKPARRADQLGHRPKRFWKEAAATAVADGYSVALDGRPLKTPAGGTVTVPTQVLAEQIAKEWAAVGDHADFDVMPLTRLTYAAIDRMPQMQDETVAEVLRYAETDLVCYPSEYPQSLTARERAAWDPVLQWAGHDLGLEFRQNLSIIHTPQPPQTLARLEALVRAMTPWEQAGLMAATPLFGSVVLALALWRGHLSGEGAYAASRVGEDFQADVWGRDAEAEKRSAGMKTQAVSLEAWFEALR